MGGSARFRFSRGKSYIEAIACGETGADMQAKYKETSAGGLAVNRIEC
jgi:L-serine deaminase